MKLLRFVLLASLPLLTSCATLVGKSNGDGADQALQTTAESDQQATLRETRERLDTVRRHIADARFNEASAALAPLADGAIYPAEVAELRAKIAAGLERGTTSTTLRQVAVARRLAFKDNFDEAEAILETLDADGPGKEEIQEVRELVNLRRLQVPAQAARRHVPEVRSLIRRGEFATAEALVEALEAGGAIPEEAAALRLELETARRDRTLARDQAASVDRALGEVEERLVLPASYGRTVVISPNLDPLELPVGTMEDLINKRVSIQLQNAGVKELVTVLSEVDGLNIIADEALEAANELTINVRDVPLKEVLSYIARNMGVAFHLGDNIVWVTESMEPPGSGPKLETRIYHLRQGFIPSLDGQEDAELEDALDSFLSDSPDGAGFRVFKTRNLIVVRDTRENLRLVEELIRTFDKPPHQVLIEARFITISNDDLRDIGSQFSTTPVAAPEVGDANSQVQLGSMLTELGALQPGAESGVAYTAFSGILGSRAFEWTLSAIEKKSSSRSLSAPRITVLNNRTARIRKGDVLYYFEEYDLEVVSGGDSPDQQRLVPSGSPTELELGITLETKVNIGNDGRTVILGLRPDITTFINWEDYLTTGGTTTGTGGTGGTGTTDDSNVTQVKLPRVHENTLETAVKVISGETVVLGGMIESAKSSRVTKVPILGDIPLLGNLFRHTVDEETPTHLLIFVTARVIDENGNFVQVVD